MNPQNLRYTEEHEWIGELNGQYVVGITDFAQEQLGDITYVELPAVGDTVEAGREMGSVESVKAASELYSPVSGEVIEVNDELEGMPEKVNTDPYGAAWFFRLQPSNPAQLEAMLSAEAYAQEIGE